MKRYIGGKLYDTDKAKEVGSWKNMQDVRNLHHFTETLYQKRTGEFFIHGAGGAMTKYAEAVGSNSWTGGERIMPMSFDEAREWAEKHLSADEYEAIFHPDESEDRVYLHIQAPATLVTELRNRAVQQGTSLTAYVVDVLTKELTEN